MSTFEQDFTGGRLHFVNRGNYSISDVIVEPLAGRVAIFTSGSENPHHVERVLSGQRFVLAFWFTCDSKKQFQIFLDGKAHTEFSYKIKESLSTNKKEEL